MSQLAVYRLQDLGLRGMARQLASQQKLHQHELSFEDRLSLLIDAEQSERMNYRYAQRLRWAKLGQSASMEEVDQRTPRGIDKGLLSKLNDLSFIRDKLNVLITGPTGVGKSYLACALGQKACRDDLSVKYVRLPRLVEELHRAQALQKKSVLFKHLSGFALLIIDDFGLAPLIDQDKRDLLEIMEDRFDKSATLITSQLPAKSWHAYITEPTLADAILDRLVHNAYVIDLNGESMRKKRAQ